MKLTSLVVTILIITLGIYDLVMVVFGGVDSSVSRFLNTTAFKHPVITFTFGFVCGHLFGYMQPPKQLLEELHGKQDTDDKRG